MSITLKSGEKIAALKQGIEGVTGETYNDLTEAVNGLKEKQYEAGKKAEYDAFWDAVQVYGNRTDYQYAFRYWDIKHLNPKYVVRPTGASTSILGRSTLETLAQDKFDFSKAAYSDTSTSSITNQTFGNCGNLIHLPDIGLQAGRYSDTFYACQSLKTIEILRFNGTNAIGGTTFQTCYELENLTIEGTIGTNGLNLQWSAKLTHDSLMSIINALADKSADTSGTVWKVTIGETNRAKLTADELEIAEKKGWNIV